MSGGSQVVTGKWMFYGYGEVTVPKNKHKNNKFYSPIISAIE